MLFLLSNYSINAQEQYDAHLVGHVVDEKTGEHLPYVTIQIKGTDIGTITDETGHYFLAAHRTRSPYDRDGDGFSEVPQLRTTTAGARVFFRTSTSSKLTLEYHHITDYRRGGNNIELPPHEADIAEQLRHNIDAGSVAFDWMSADSKHFVSAYSALQHIGRDSYFGAGQDPNAYGTSTDLTSNTGLQYRFSYPCGKMNGDLSVGAEYTYNGLHDRMLGYNRDIRQNVHVAGVYAQNEWKNKKWSVLIGARLEKHNLLTKPVCTIHVPPYGLPLLTDWCCE